MKIFTYTTSLILALSYVTHAKPQTLQSAKVTKTVNKVNIYQAKKKVVKAKIGAVIRGATAVQTGRRSRAELTFQDKTITRLGANSVFSFRKGSRDIELQRGSILLQVPKAAGGATIRTATVTAAITGTTLMMEYNKGKWIKLITLEGKVSLNLGKQKVKVPAGKMIVMRPDGAIITKPVDVDLKQLLKTSILAGNKVFQPLPLSSLQAINHAVTRQERLKRQGRLVGENIVERRDASALATDKGIISAIPAGRESPILPDVQPKPESPGNN